MRQWWVRRVGAGVAVAALVLVQPATALGVRGPNGQEVTVSQSSGLDPAGATVTVRGSGFDLNKGIYVAFCVDKGPGQQPTPCLGGVDMEGSSGSSAWISSNPPSYGESLAKPFTETGGKGSFEVRLTVKAKDQFTNCLDRRSAPRGCVIGTRADHTRTADRSADVLVPVTFRGATSSPAPTATSSTTQPAGQTGGETQQQDTKKGGLAGTGGLALGLIGLVLVLLATGAGFLIAARRRTTSEETTR